MKCYKSIVLVILMAIVVLPQGLLAQTITLKTEFQDTQPKYIKNADGTFSGLCVELIQLIEKKSNFRFSYPKEFIPSKRIASDLETGATDVHLGLGITDERLKTMVFPEPMYDLSYVMIMNASDKTVVKTANDIKALGKDGVVLAVFGTTAVLYLKDELGLQVDDSGTTTDNNFEKLAGGRGRFFVYHNLGMLWEMNQPKYKDKFKLVPIALTGYTHYITFSKMTPTSTVDAFVKVVKSLKASGEWTKITDKYLQAK